MGVKEDLPFYSCPRYARCSVNNCPLHPGYPNLIVDPEDAEQKCGVSKNMRTRIAAEFPGVLKFKGLTGKEFAGKLRWDSLTPEEQAKRREKAAKLRGNNVCKEMSAPQKVAVE